MPRSRRARTLRWLSPVVVLAAIAVLATVPAALASDAAPSIPALSPQQLLTRVRSVQAPQALSGTIRLTANLGIPNLSQLADQGGGRGIDVFSLLSGNHDARVWFDGPQRARIALLDQLSETDVVRNGRDLWIWQSAGSLVTHQQLAPSSPTGSTEPSGADGTQPVTTPAQLAKQFLAKIDPSTAVSVAAPVRVAGRSAYELVLSPRAAGSTIDHVAIAVDSTNSLPLRVAVIAKGSTKPALQLGFNSISFSRPGASTFSFTPPPGSHHTANAFAPPELRTHRRPPGDVSPGDVSPGHGHGATVVGKDWTAVVIAKAATLPSGLDEVLKAATAVPGGRLLQTSLVNVLLLNDGRVAIGAVTPAVLESAVPSAA